MGLDNLVVNLVEFLLLRHGFLGLADVLERALNLAFRVGFRIVPDCAGHSKLTFSVARFNC